MGRTNQKLALVSVCLFTLISAVFLTVKFLSPEQTVNAQIPVTPPTSIKPGMRADGDGNGIVDGRDFSVWVNNYGRQSVHGANEGDYNNDGRVDGRDFVVWLNNFTRT